MTLNQTLTWSLLTPASFAVGLLIMVGTMAVGKLIRDAAYLAALRALRLNGVAEASSWGMAVSLLAGPVALWLMSLAIAHLAAWLDTLLLVPAALAPSLMMILPGFRATRFCGITGGRWIRNWWLNRRRTRHEDEEEVPF